MGWRINTLLTDLVDTVTEYWGWTGIEPEEVVAKNEFGNLIVRDEANQFWRICPEDGYCVVVANSANAYNQLIADQAFLHDWYMVKLVQQAEEKLGKLERNFSYSFVTPPILGGEYGRDNICLAPTREVVENGGTVASQLFSLVPTPEIT